MTSRLSFEYDLVYACIIIYNKEYSPEKVFLYNFAINQQKIVIFKLFIIYYKLYIWFVL